jgi:hypothetical protein
LAGFSACSKEMNTLTVPTKHNKNLTLGQIAEILPGMGSVMMEYSHRFYVAYYAAKAKNWDLAAYQLHEMLEIQEVGEATRPEHATALKAFEENYLNKVTEAVKTKEWQTFDTAYKRAVVGCNNCHVNSGHGYIRYKLPATPPALLSMAIK